MFPKLDSLMARYLERRAEAEAIGIEAGDLSEVTPYEAGPVQPIDPKVAWEEALVALSVVGLKAKSAKAPPGWVQLVGQNEPHVAIAFCVGNFPQLVRHFHLLLQKQTNPLPAPGAAIDVPQFLEWAGQATAFPQAIQALAGLRLSRQFDRADAFLAKMPAIPTEWKAAWDNEVAALAWHRGDTTAAVALWKSQPPTLPVRFNLAMASLFLGDVPMARIVLEQVIGELPESSGWHHLARLYHTLSLI